MKLTTQDVVPSFRISLQDNILKSLDKLNAMVQLYNNTDSLFELESLKKEMNSELVYFATLYAKCRAYKGPNHTYLEREVKELKAQALNKLMSEQGMRVTAAESLVYDSEFYKERLRVIKQLIMFLIKVEELYNRYDYTLTCIVQSVSVGGKEYSNNQKTG